MQLIDLLLQAGADSEIKSNSGLCPSDLAEAFGCEQIGIALRQSKRIYHSMQETDLQMHESSEQNNVFHSCNDTECIKQEL